MEDNETVIGREKFFGNLTGTTLLEVSLLSSLPPICCTLHALFMVITTHYIPYSGMRTWSHFLLDFCILILPGLLLTTVFANIVIAVVTTLAALVFALCFVAINQQCTKNVCQYIFSSCITDSRPNFILHYRATVLTVTTICILAVDFRIFPRRFAKVKIYGTSVMDCGVAGFMVAHGLVAPEIKMIHEGLNTQRWKYLLQSLKKCVALIFIGFIRLMMVKGSNYHEQVEEYGVHWNFFFSLTMVKMSSSLLFAGIPVSFIKHPGIIGLLLASCYEALLTSFGLKNFLLYGYNGLQGRSGFLEANREGILSIIGYLSLYLLAMEIGIAVRKKRPFYRLIWMLLLFNVICWGCLQLSISYIDRISRRMVNLSYIVWQVALQSYTLLLFICVDFVKEIIDSPNRSDYSTPSRVHGNKDSDLSPPPNTENTPLLQTMGDEKHLWWYPSQLMRAIDRNQLFCFLLANILTGIVNLGIQTIFIDDSVALGILCIYLFILYATLFWLHCKNITLKL